MGYSHLFNSLRSLKVPTTRLHKCFGVTKRAAYSVLANTSEARVHVGINDLSVGSEYEGFQVKSIQEVQDLALTAVRLSHLKTGADYLHIAREDSNNVFCVGFRTTPKDSTGVSHILEHTVLCGSKEYPGRDPFFKMLNRSLSTFMNAMTGPDYTIYPFSSQNSKDFKNLLSVYLDAVFYPQLRELDFLQEGWRLENENPLSQETPLQFKGVVFNEMKGAFSDASYGLNQHVMRNLLPSHTYGNCSGGDPPKILDLTWQQLKDFHAKHYHPSNSRFYTYGNMPLKEHLQFINQNYLKSFEKIAPSEEVPNEKRWSQPRRINIEAREDPFATNPEKQTSAVVSYALSDINDLYETFVLQILGELLTGGPNSPFYHNLLEPNIGTGYSPVTGFDSHTKDTTFTIGLQGIHSKDVDKVLGIIRSTFEEVVRTGFPAERIEAVLHSIELSVKHQTSNFGLSMAMNLTPLWNHGSDPVEALYINSKVEKFRQNLHENPDYLKNKVRQYFIDNTHQLVAVMQPDKEFETKLEQEEKSILEAKCQSLSEEDKTLIFAKNQELIAMQNNVNDTECLPTLQLSDISTQAELVQLDTVKLLGVPVQVAVQPTNGITYFHGVLNTSGLPEKLKIHLPLFCMAATKMGAGDMDYRQLDQQIEHKTGGLSFGLHLTEGPGSVQSYEQGIAFSSHCLDRNLPDMFQLWQSIFNRLRLVDENRLETLIRNLVGDLGNSLTHSGHHFAMTHAGSSLTPTAHLKELDEGVTYIRRVKAIAETNQFEPLLECMHEIAKHVLVKNNMRCALNMTADSQEEATKHLEGFVSSVKGSPIDQTLWTVDSEFQPAVQRTHYVLPVPVNFTSKVVPGAPYLSPDFAPLRVLAGIMSSKFLHPEIREKGGAYGGGAAASATGLFSFYSYRDPKSLETIDTFDRAVEWALKANYNEEAIKEAKLRVFQKIDSPTPPSGKGMRLFLSHISDEQFAAQRQQLIDVTKDDLVRVCQDYLRQPAVHGVTIIGPPNDITTRDPSWNVEFS
ncbi:presequence protease, mitochondrial-like [Daphnia pulicaria]|uniref:presequence protease, mitochondrial-like n=1 Tax=Daphnia pulicaria TaxID=35523 RepID=UPI001EEC6D73|nr:presequence protease, mitochondrial-like [Daphnia pulicaria]